MNSNCEKESGYNAPSAFILNTKVMLKEFKLKQAYVKVEYSMKLILMKSVFLLFPCFSSIQFCALAVNAELHLSSNEGYLALECNVSKTLK